MINIYKINKEKFKSIYISVNFTMNVNKEENSANALLASVLAKSSIKYNSQKEIEKFMASKYGASFDVNVEKYGDLYNIEFMVEGINKKFLPNNEDVIDDLITFLYDIIYNPNIKNNSFDETIVKREKEFILDRIRTKKDDKLRYGILRMEEIMCQNEGFGMYVYGDEETVNNITAASLYNHYQKVINNSCVTVIISGNLKDYDNIEDTVKNKFKDKINGNMTYDDLIYNCHSEKTQDKINETFEKSDTSQSVLSMGIRIKDATSEDFYKLSLYNAILGATPSSKLFQNFREKESLAYTVRSRYYRFKDMIIIFAGIEKENYDKAKQVITEQISDIVNGKISDEEFNAAKESIIADLKEWDDSKIALSKMTIANILINKENNITVDDMIEKIQNITKQDIIEIAKKLEVEEIFLLGGDINE